MREMPLNGLLNELTKLLECDGDVNEHSCPDGLTGEEKKALELVNKIIKKQKEATEYDLLKYKLANDALDISLWDMDVVGANPSNPDTKVIWSKEVRQIMGFEDESGFPNVLGSVTNRIHPEDKKYADESFEAHVNDLTGQTPFNIEFRIMTKDGEYRYFKSFGTTLRDSRGKPLRVAGALVDINERKETSNQLKILYSIIHNAPEFNKDEAEEHQKTERVQALRTMERILNSIEAMIYVTLPETGEILFINDLMKEHYGLSDDVIGQYCYRVLQENMHEKCSFCPCHQLDLAPDSVVTWDEPSPMTMRLYRNTDRYIEWHDGTKVHVQYSVDITDYEQTTRSLTEALTGITMAQDSLEKALVEKNTDPLTGIYNRRYLNDKLPGLILSLSRSYGYLSILMVDIDYFKKFNDTYGHAAGDECLKKIAELLNGSLSREDDFVARFGGEEFVIVLPNTGETGACIVAEKLLQKIKEYAIPHEGSEIASYVTISIGITSGTVEHTHSPDAYIKQADKMLYKSKSNGRNTYSFESMCD